MEQELKGKYINLQSNLKNIKQELEEIAVHYEQLSATVKENILIDNNIYQNEEFETIKRNLNSILNEIRTNVIPNINNNI